MVETPIDPGAELLRRLRQPLPAEEMGTVVDAALAHCRALYGDGRSAEALPLAQQLLDRCQALGDSLQARRSAIVCGLLAADTADVVMGIEYQVQALRLATGDEDRPAMSGIWNNIGTAFSLAGNHENAVRCYRRALALVEPDPGARRLRHISCANLANSLFQLGEVAEGIRYGERALLESSPEIVAADPNSAVIVRRNITRLLIAGGRIPEASVLVAEATALADAVDSKRARIAVELARAALDLARGHSDVALTRIDQALERAREVPAALRDALAFATRSEEAAGHPARALMRLEELSRLIYGSAIERARSCIAQAGFSGAVVPFSGEFGSQDRVRLEMLVDPPAAPEGWRALQRLAAASALRMEVSGGHGMRVGAVTKAFALYLGMPPLQSLEIGLACELHDIGMLSIPEGILSKRGALNAAERLMVRRHSEAGAEMLCDDQHPRTLLAREVARYHHARWDGAGHPERVGGEFIPLAARMCSIADAYDMMVCGFAGREPRTMEAALQELSLNAGSQFDPGLVVEFDAMIRGEMEGRGVDLGEGPGMQDFLGLVRSLTEDRGFV